MRRVARATRPLRSDWWPPGSLARRSSPGRARPPPRPTSTATCSRDAGRRHGRLARASATCSATAWPRSRATACPRSCARTCPTAAPSWLARSASAPTSTSGRARSRRTRTRSIAATTAPYALILNPDVRLEPGLRAAARRPRRGARALRRRGPAAARERRRDAALAPPLPDRRRHARAAHAAARARARRRGRAARPLPRRRAGRARSSATGCSAPACCCAASMLDEIGGFDEGFPMYGEDIELQYRARRAGWERWYVPGCGRDARLPARRRPHVPLAPHLVAPARHGALRAQAPRDAAALSRC